MRQKFLDNNATEETNSETYATQVSIVSGKRYQKEWSKLPEGTEAFAPEVAARPCSRTVKTSNMQVDDGKKSQRPVRGHKSNFGHGSAASHTQSATKSSDDHDVNRSHAVPTTKCRRSPIPSFRRWPAAGRVEKKWDRVWHATCATRQCRSRVDSESRSAHHNGWARFSLKQATCLSCPSESFQARTGVSRQNRSQMEALSCLPDLSKAAVFAASAKSNANSITHNMPAMHDRNWVVTH